MGYITQLFWYGRDEVRSGVEDGRRKHQRKRNQLYPRAVFGEMFEGVRQFHGIAPVHATIVQLWRTQVPLKRFTVEAPRAAARVKSRETPSPAPHQS